MRRNSRVFKKCVLDGRCRNEKCTHPWYCEYWKGGQRYRLSIPKAFPDEDANPKTKTEASTVWLPKFISEVNQALAEGRKPFVKAPKPLDVDTLTSRTSSTSTSCRATTRPSASRRSRAQTAARR